MKKLVYILPLAALFFACSPKASNQAETNTDNDVISVKPIITGGYTTGSSAMIPKATAFRMSGDYANNVAVTVDTNGNLTYFPDPKDISDNSKPVDLGNGWWLNRQGISKNSVFTRYTFDEYMKLPEVPSPVELKAAIIPGAYVSEMQQLPYPINQAMSHLKEIKELLNN